MNNIRAPKGAVIIIRKKGESTTAQLRDSPKAKRWLEILSSEVDSVLSSDKMRYKAPEHPIRCFRVSVKTILDKLRTGEKVVFWDVNRELLQKNPDFSSTSFGEACQQMFG